MSSYGWQIRHGETGYLVDVGETMTVAKHLFNLCTDKVRMPTIRRVQALLTLDVHLSSVYPCVLIS